MFKTAAAISIATTLVSAEWQMTDVDGITTLLNVDGVPGDSESFYGAAGQNGRGSGLLESHDAGDHHKLDIPQGGFMDLGIAVGADGETISMVGMGLFVRASGAADFVKVGDGISGFSQDLKATDKGFGSAGSWQQKVDGVTTAVNGVAYSLDNGVHWDLFDIGANTTDGYYTRYGAFPTDDTWYVSTGTWPMDDDEAKSVDSRPLSRHLHRDGSLRTALKDEGAGYIGAVFKTTDGGASFSEVLNTKGYYLNGIHCYDELNCITAAEGSLGSAGYHTTDGGATWVKIVENTSTSSSMMAAYMVSATDFWFAGGIPGRSGTFYHSTDGKTTTSEDLSDAYAAALTFRGGKGYAAVMGRQTCGVAKYEE